MCNSWQSLKWALSYFTSALRGLRGADLFLLDLPAELEVEGVHNGREVSANAEDGQADHDNQGPGNSIGGGEVFGLHGEVDNGDDAQAGDEARPTIVDEDEQGRPPVYSHKSKDGGDCSSKCESHVDATKDPRPLFPAIRVELTDEDGEGDPVDLLRLVHQLAKLHWASADQEGPQGDGGDAQREQDKSKGGGALLQGEAAEHLGVVEATTKLVFLNGATT